VSPRKDRQLVAQALRPSSGFATDAALRSEFRTKSTVCILSVSSYSLLVANFFVMSHSFVHCFTRSAFSRHCLITNNYFEPHSEKAFIHQTIGGLDS